MCFRGADDDDDLWERDADDDDDMEEEFERGADDDDDEYESRRYRRDVNDVWVRTL